MHRHSKALTATERRAVAGLTGIFAFRMLGLFLVLPVFALYALGLDGHTPLLVGLALGIYGLTQALFQIPFGVASDRLGRKPVIAAGLLIFAAGSVIAAVAGDIVSMIIGRALQGTGAIGAAVIALVADSTREQIRSRAMAVIGVSVGVSFAASLVLGPALATSVGVAGIFWLTAALGMVGLAILTFWVPTPAPGATSTASESVPRNLARVLRNTQLLRLNFGILVLHATLTAVFVVVPVALVRYGALAADAHWKIYVPVMLISAVVLFPLLTLAEGRARTGPAILVAIIAVSQLVLFAAHRSLIGLACGLLIFFSGFNVLEAILPTSVSKAAPAEAKGTAIGVYSTFQFFGAFVGGVAGGWLHGKFDIGAVFAFTAAFLGVWLFLILKAPAPLRYVTHRLRIGERTAADALGLMRQLAAIPGVAQVTVAAAEDALYVEVDERNFDLKQLDRFSSLQ